jgi:hypothetical protein
MSEAHASAANAPLARAHVENMGERVGAQPIPRPAQLAFLAADIAEWLDRA